MEGTKREMHLRTNIVCYIFIRKAGIQKPLKFLETIKGSNEGVHHEMIVREWLDLTLSENGSDTTDLRHDAQPY